MHTLRIANCSSEGYLNGGSCLCAVCARRGRSPAAARAVRACTYGLHAPTACSSLIEFPFWSSVVSLLGLPLERSAPLASRQRRAADRCHFLLSASSSPRGRVASRCHCGCLKEIGYGRHTDGAKMKLDFGRAHGVLFGALADSSREGLLHHRPAPPPACSTTGLLHHLPAPPPACSTTCLLHYLHPVAALSRV